MNKEGFSFKRVLKWLGWSVLGIVVIVIFASSGGDSAQPASETAEQTETTQKTPQMPPEQAWNELNDLMDKSKKADLVKSYDFSKIGENLYRWDIFVGGAWYKSTVQQKKDFIAYIGIRKEAITGYRHFELHDAYTNEKVGEITAFSGSIEVYK